MHTEPTRDRDAARHGPTPAPDARTNAWAAAELFAGLAARCRDVVMSPGSRSTPLVLAARARPDLRLHVVLDERAAAFVALGLARQRRRPVILLCTSGSAGAHYLPALCEADRSGVPLIAVTADRPPELHACGAPQTMVQAGLFAPHVRHERTLFGLDAAGWRHAGLVAADRAALLPAGPVHLNVAMRKPLWVPGCEVTPPSASLPAVSGTIALGATDLDTLAASLSGLPRGVVFCGARVQDGAAGEMAPGDAALGEAALALALAAGWPLLAEATSGVRFGPHLRLGAVIAAFDPIIRCDVLPPPQVAVHVGAAPLSKPVLQWLGAAGHVLRIDPSGERRDPMLAGGTLVVADPIATLAALAGRIVPAPTPWGPIWRAAEDAAERALDAAGAELAEAGVARAVAASLAPGTPLIVAASMPARDLDAFAAPRRDGPSAHGNRGLNGIDGLVSTAAGHALAARRATLLCGDLALLHDAGGLLAARALGVRLDVVVIDNGGGGIFAELPIAAHPTAFEPCFLTPQPTSIAALCRGAGAEVHAIGSIQALRDALASLAAGVRVLVVTLDRARSAAHRARTHAAVATAVRAVIDNSKHRLHSPSPTPPQEDP